MLNHCVDDIVFSSMFQHTLLSWETFRNCFQMDLGVPHSVICFFFCIFRIFPFPHWYRCNMNCFAENPWGLRADSAHDHYCAVALPYFGNVSRWQRHKLWLSIYWCRIDSCSCLGYIIARMCITWNTAREIYLFLIHISGHLVKYAISNLIGFNFALQLDIRMHNINISINYKSEIIFFFFDT